MEVIIADHVMKKYKALVEKTLYISEELEIICETERQAEELLDDYCAGENDERVLVVEKDTQEETVDYQSITSSEELGVDEFMEYSNKLH